MNGTYLIQQVLLWVIHVERIALLVLLGMGGATLALRILALGLSRRSPPAGAPPWLRGPRGLALLAASLLVASSATFLAMRPDNFFMTRMGMDAAQKRNAAGVITYFEPLVRWNLESPDIARSLAHAYFEKGRFRDGTAVLHRAIARSPTLSDHVICGTAHLAVGEAFEARSHAEAAKPFAQRPEEHAAIERLAAAAKLPPPARP